MKSKLLLLLSLIGLCACEPTIPTPQQTAPIVHTATPLNNDTITTIDLTAPATEIVVRIVDDSIYVDASNVHTVNKIDMDYMYLRRSETGDITFLQIDDIVLYKETSPYTVNHSYKWIEDQCLEIQKGNTIDGIIADTNKEGFKITKQQLYNCNPKLKQHGLQVGQVVCLTCN